MSQWSTPGSSADQDNAKAAHARLRRALGNWNSRYKMNGSTMDSSACSEANDAVVIEDNLGDEDKE